MTDDNAKFKKINSLDKRLAESRRTLQKYPDRVPCIVENYSYDKRLPILDKNKFLVPKDLTIGQFVHVIRKRMTLNSSEAMFMFINGNLPPTDAMISELYASYADKDGFLYIFISGESVFGNFLEL